MKTLTNYHGKVALFPMIATDPESSQSESGCSRYRPNTLLGFGCGFGEITGRVWIQYPNPFDLI